MGLLNSFFGQPLYLIGRSLNFRAVGFAAALVAMFRGINSIAVSNMIDLANPKMILTDFPAAIGVVLIVLATCEWLKQPGGNGAEDLLIVVCVIVADTINLFGKIAINWFKTLG